MKQLKLATLFCVLSLSFTQSSYSKNDSIRIELEHSFFNAKLEYNFNLLAKKPSKPSFLSKSYKRLPKEMDKLIEPYSNRFKKYTNLNYELNSALGVFAFGQKTNPLSFNTGFNLSTKSFIQKELKFKKLSILFLYNYDWQEFNILKKSKNYNSFNTIFSFDLNKGKN